MSNNIEYEGKILDIDVDRLRSQIMNGGGELVGEYFFRRYVFEVIPPKKGIWARLRTDGFLTTLTIKKITNDTVSGTQEWEVEVSDFETAFIILKKMGLVPKGYQENRRIEFKYEGALISLDTWPKIPPYMEVEGSDQNHVESVVKSLGFHLKDLTGKNTEEIYTIHGYDIKKTADLRFSLTSSKVEHE